MILRPLRFVSIVLVIVTVATAAIKVHEATGLLWLAILAAALVLGLWAWVWRLFRSWWAPRRQALENRLTSALEGVVNRVESLEDGKSSDSG
jgi:hypothetical protein